jgi:hypothetical protein
MMKGSLGKENLPTIVSILLAIALAIYSSIAQKNASQLVIILPLIAVLIAFLLFLSVISRAEARINQSLDKRLPATEHLEARQEVERELTKLVESTTDFIIATGGRSRNKTYLKSIESKLDSDDLIYHRFIYQEEITHDMCEHLCAILNKSNVYIRQIKEQEYGNILVVKSGFLIVLPVPGHGGLMGIKIPNSDSAQRMSRYVMMLNQDSQQISTSEQVKGLCEQCMVQNALAEHQPKAIASGIGPADVPQPRST